MPKLLFTKHVYIVYVFMILEELHFVMQDPYAPIGVRPSSAALGSYSNRLSDASAHVRCFTPYWLYMNCLLLLVRS